MPKTPEQLTLAQARQAALRAQGLWGAKPSATAARAQIGGLVGAVGAVQLDTISVLARSHQLVAHTRLGALSRETIESAYWSGGGEARNFEFWSHAACLLPVEDWPLFEFRREAFRQRGQRWHQVPTKMLKEVERRVADEGPVVSGDLGPSRKENYWWAWSDTKVALEWLFDVGVLACVNRVNWKRQYDLASRAIPAEHRKPVDEVAALTELIRRSLNSLGVATRDDILDVHRLNRKELRVKVDAAWEQFTADPRVTSVRVNGWEQPAYATAELLNSLDRSRPKRSVALSPFDNLIWYRPRLERLFGLTHRLEAYTPAAKRTYGYFAMPVLSGDQIIGRLDPNKQGATFRAVNVTFLSDAPSATEVNAMADAIVEAASWINAESIAVENCPKAKRPLLQALATRGVK